MKLRSCKYRFTDETIATVPGISSEESRVVYICIYKLMLYAGLGLSYA